MPNIASLALIIGSRSDIGRALVRLRVLAAEIWLSGATVGTYLRTAAVVQRGR
jgi:hypothetical protein